MNNMTYCLKFNLYAYHSVKIEDRFTQSHHHNWTIVTYIDANTGFEQFHKIEDNINEFLKDYTNLNLNDIPYFGSVNPTLENIGEFLFEQIYHKLIDSKILLKKLEISEIPSRIYVVRHKNIDNGSKKISPHLLFNEVVYSIIERAKNGLEEEEKQQPQEEIMSVLPTIDLEPPAVETDISHIPEEKEYKYPYIKALSAMLFVAAAGLLLMLYVNRKGIYPWGSDTFGHIFKANLLYDSLKRGIVYPLYTDLWYNGIQPFRYWAPIPYYILAGFQFMANGNPIAAYNIFVYFCFVVGAYGWILWGIKEKRVFFSAVLGILWFSMPDNIRVFFSEGNLPRITIAVLLPYMFFFIWQYAENKRKYSLIAVILIMAVISMCHLMIAAMLGITTFFFLVYYGIQNKNFGRPLQILIGMLLGIGLCGAWLYPALQGGLMSIDSAAVAEVMKSLTFPFTQSLNPTLRNYNIEIYYFGISFFAVALIGVFMSDKKSVPGFLALLTVFLGTTTAFVPILIKLPLNQLLWMMRFTPIAYAIFTLSMIMWKRAKRYFMIMIMLVIIIDCGVSFRQLAYNSNPSADTAAMLDEAAEITNQRIAILDVSEFGSFPSYYLCSDKHKIPYAYGWAWQGATTASNIVLLNTALEKEYYPYMFDRCIELGCDTVLVKKNKVKDFDKLTYNAGLCNYYFVKEYNNAYLYKRDTPETFGMISQYYGLAIGKTASNISLEFPGYEIGRSDFLEDYTPSELLKYKMLYISDFKYRNKAAAEKLMRDAAAGGVKVIVDMNKVPNDPVTNRLTFLDVTAQPIQFENKLPDLHVKDVVYFPTTFKEENRKWNTVYLENVPVSTGFSWMGGNKLSFIGESDDGMISFIGFNLLYHGIINEDRTVIDIYAGVMGTSANTLPKREIVPISIDIQNDRIYLNTPPGGVNTTLAYLDAFESGQKTYPQHNLLCTTETETQIKITYPYLKKGIIVSVSAFLVSILFLLLSFKKRGEKQ